MTDGCIDCIADLRCWATGKSSAYDSASVCRAKSSRSPCGKDLHLAQCCLARKPGSQAEPNVKLCGRIYVISTCMASTGCDRLRLSGGRGPVLA